MSNSIEEYKPVEALITKTCDDLIGKVYQIETPAGFSEAMRDKSLAVKIRTSLEKTRKELKAPMLERSRLLDSEAKRLTAMIALAEEPLQLIVSAEQDRKAEIKRKKEAANEERIRGIRFKIAEIEGAHIAVFMLASTGVKNAIEKLEATNLNDGFDEFKDMASQAKVAALEKLNEMYAEKVDTEERDRAAEVLRKEEAERVAKEREAFAKQKAEQDAKDAAVALQLKQEREELEKAKQELRDKELAQREAATDDKKAEEPKPAPAKKKPKFGDDYSPAYVLVEIGKQVDCFLDGSVSYTEALDEIKVYIEEYFEDKS